MEAKELRIGTNMSKERLKIGGIGNYYGALNITKIEGKYYWCIENFNTDFDDLGDWEEIDKELYDSLFNYQKRYELRIT